MNKLYELVRRLTGAEIPDDNTNVLGYWTRVAGLAIDHGGDDKAFREGWLQADLELVAEQAKVA